MVEVVEVRKVVERKIFLLFFHSFSILFHSSLMKSPRILQHTRTYSISRGLPFLLNHTLFFPPSSSSYGHHSDSRRNPHHKDKQKEKKKTQTNTEMCPKKMEKLKDEMIK